MDVEKINQPNATQASFYLRKKFEHFKKGLYTKSSRRKKCLEYWIAARSDRRDLVHDVYQRVFHEIMDVERGEEIELAREREASRHGSMASQDMMRNKKLLRADANTTLLTLNKWRDDGDWQVDGFIERLQSITAFMEDEDLLSGRSFKTEFNAFFEKELTSSVERGKNSISHEGAFIAAAKQQARIEFEAFSPNWGRLNAFFEEQFKAGVWGNDSAKLAWKRTGFTAEVEAAIAIGMQLNVEGEMSWDNRDRKLTLGGDGEVFLGAKADLSGKLSVNALKGLEAAISAGFFAGFSAKVHGTAKFSYMGKLIASVDAEASIDFGVRATFEASISAPLFGPTAISFGAGISLGLGTSTSVGVKINFNETRILLTTEFRKLVYIPTLLKGYKTDLMDMEYRNSYYLNKCILAVEAFIAEMEEEITAYKKTPSEKRPLLAHY